MARGRCDGTDRFWGRTVNWLDFVLLAIIAVGAVMGLRIGLIGAAFTVVGVFVGWLLAGQWSDDVGGLFGDSLSNDTIVTAISYAIIIAGAVVVSRFAAKFIKPLLTVFTLGLSSMVDRLGGLALGALFGAAISAVIIIALARLTYDFDTSVVTDLVPAQVAGQVAELDEQLAKVENVREQLETALTESKLVSIFIDISDAIPASTFGFVPSDFKAALDILEGNIP